MADNTIRIGTRKSALALWQAEWVKKRLTELQPDIRVEIVKITTKGDKILDAPLAQIGGKGLFVKEIEEELIAGRIDIAVHSMKDMPSDLPERLMIGAVPEREDPFDALVSHGDLLMHLPEGARIGTSSLRRAAQLKRLRPDAIIHSLRGNLDTRLRKLAEGQYDAVVVAVAGLVRMGLEEKIVEYLGPPDFLPAVGQGALAIETRSDDRRVNELIAPLENFEARVTTTGERAFLAELKGGCQVPIAAHASIIEGRLYLTGMVADLDGSRIIRDEVEGKPLRAKELGHKLGRKLLQAGADQILDELYRDAKK
jgi:hydroxymethylbilane synthase